MIRAVRLLLSILLLGVAVSASAQVVQNPTTIVIGVSADHAQVTKYEVGFFLAGATDPVQVADVGTGAAVAGELTKPIPTYPIGQTYTLKARAWVNTLASGWSPNSNPFGRSPASPVSILVR